MILALGATLPVDGNDRTAFTLRDLIHDEDAPSTSLNILNGYMDWENVDPGWSIGREFTQRGSAVDAAQAARTVNLDWTWRVFGENTTGTPYSSTYGDDIIEAGLSRVVPGGAKEFWSKWAGYALVTFSIFWASDAGSRGESPSYLTSVLLEANGAYVEGQLRHSGQCMDGANSTEFYKRARVWSGHALIPISEGFNRVALRILGDRRVRMSRTWASNLQVVQFKYPGDQS